MGVRLLVTGASFVFLKCIYNIPKIVKKNEIESAARQTGRVSSDK
jgi:hypothetical protein